ncbi:MAG: hypothetical protein JW822_02800 [Spirochaetales bacterium]|nr:hypothetical protein [Spirochaetales bacterium]
MKRLGILLLMLIVMSVVAFGQDFGKIERDGDSLVYRGGKAERIIVFSGSSSWTFSARDVKELTYTPTNQGLILTVIMKDDSFFQVCLWNVMGIVFKNKSIILVGG